MGGQTGTSQGHPTPTKTAVGELGLEEEARGTLPPGSGVLPLGYDSTRLHPGSLGEEGSQQ